jgi:ubiquitin C-terminal hydrolase
MEFNMKEVLGKFQDCKYELLQVCHHKGSYYSSEGFGVVIKNETNGKWLHFEDKLVYNTSKEEALSFFSDNEGENDSAVYLVYKKVSKFFSHLFFFLFILTFFFF